MTPTHCHVWRSSDRRKERTRTSEEQEVSRVPLKVINLPVEGESSKKPANEETPKLVDEGKVDAKSKRSESEEKSKAD